MLKVAGECEMRNIDARNSYVRENSRKGIEHNKERNKAGYFKPTIQEEYTGTSFTVFNFTTANHNHTVP